jgi:hypothetical protein
MKKETVTNENFFVSLDDELILIKGTKARTASSIILRGQQAAIYTPETIFAFSPSKNVRFFSWRTPVLNPHALFCHFLYLFYYLN